MRFFIVLFSLFLVSCATPKSAPQAYYGGVYAPGKAEISSNGRFESSAGVISSSDVATARKAAYARFMVSAKAKGYRYFRITKEKTQSGLGKTFKLSGRAYKSGKAGGNVYRVEAIDRLLNGLPLAEPAPKKKRKIKRASVAKKATPKPVSRPAQKPVVDELPAVSDDPTVIMAPTDITGSVKKTKVSMETTSSVSTPAIAKTDTALDMPSALVDVPSGVTLRRD
jgi:hypothetical protein